MKKNGFVPQIPYGTRDFLPYEANQKRVIESSLAQLFARWGYDEIVTPTFEYLETLAVGVSDDAQSSMFKFFDKNNRILALRADMTTPLARVAATRLRETETPLRLFYLTNVFRYEQAQAGRQCEFYQAGAELMGVPGPGADAEMVALAVESMLDTGLQNFQISLGQVEFIHGIMKELDLKPEQEWQIKQRMVRRDLVGLEEVLAKSGVTKEGQKLLQQIPLLHGREDMLEKTYQAVNNPVSRAALDNLAEIYNLLKSYGVDKYVNFDLGIIRDFDYYTGMVFEGYTPGLGFPLCGGGRYDNMVASFGVQCPATGFALGIERVMLAMERQGIAVASAPKNIYIGWDDNGLPAAIQQAAKLRMEGHSVELALQPQSREEAANSQLRKGYDQLVFVAGSK